MGKLNLSQMGYGLSRTTKELTLNSPKLLELLRTGRESKKTLNQRESLLATKARAAALVEAAGLDWCSDDLNTHNLDGKLPKLGYIDEG